MCSRKNPQLDENGDAVINANAEADISRKPRNFEIVRMRWRRIEFSEGRNGGIVTSQQIGLLLL
jgi:hypothetical protein